jgi:type II secretory pathway predicted ATPase ExeA
MEMRKQYQHFFGFEKDPFAANLGAVYLITVEIGSGKSTTIRYLQSRLHPSEYKLLYVTATTGSIMAELGMKPIGIFRALMIGTIKRQALELFQDKKKNTVLVVDEASLLRLEVFAERHTFVSLKWIANLICPLFWPDNPT